MIERGRIPTTQISKYNFQGIGCVSLVEISIYGHNLELIAFEEQVNANNGILVFTPICSSNVAREIPLP